MAEEEATVEATETTEEQQPPKDNTKMVVIILIVLSILVMVLTPLITFMAVQQISDTGQKLPPKTVSLELPLNPLEVNVKDTMGTKIIQTELTVVVNDRDMKGLFTDQSEENPKGKLRAIRHILISVISSKNMDELLAKDAQDKLAKEIMLKLNEFLRENTETSGMVTNVLFTRYIIQ